MHCTPARAGRAARLPKLLIPIALFLPLAAGCKEAPSEAKKGGAAGKRPAVAIRTTTPQRISIQRQVEVSGTLISPDQARVSSEVAGVVRQVQVELGQEVKPGQVLLHLEPRELALALRRAESLLRQTEAELGIDGVQVKEPPPDDQVAAVRLALANRDDARAQLARSERLAREGLLAQSDLDTSQTKFKVNDASYQAALEKVHSLRASLQDRRAAYELAQKKLQDAVIRAPVGGQIFERLVYPGEFIRENTPVVTVVQVHPLKLKTAVQEKNAPLIASGLPVRFQVEPFPGTTFEGKVAYISPAVDQGTRTFVVEALVQNADRRLKPGYFAKGVIFTNRDENVLAIPEDTISTLAGVSTVFVVEQDKIRQQILTLGPRQGKLVEVLEGLKGDEVLAANNLSQLATGVTVEIHAKATTSQELPR